MSSPIDALPPHIASAALDVRPTHVAIDVDHTLLREDLTISPATVTAVAASRADGLEIVLASSRPPRAMLDHLTRLDLVGEALFVALQGAMVARYLPGGGLDVVQEEPLGLEDARAVLGLAARLGLAVSWYRGEEWLVSEIDATVRREAEVVGLVPTVATLTTEREPPGKILLVTNRERLGEVLELVGRLSPNLAVQPSNGGYLEITRTGVDKASGLRAVLRRLGGEPQGLVAIGDGENDLGMYALAAVAVAPANASGRVMALATHRTDSNDEDGVATALGALVRARAHRSSSRLAPGRDRLR